MTFTAYLFTECKKKYQEGRTEADHTGTREGPGSLRGEQKCLGTHCGCFNIVSVYQVSIFLTISDI